MAKFPLPSDFTLTPCQICTVLSLFHKSNSRIIFTNAPSPLPKQAHSRSQNAASCWGVFFGRPIWNAHEGVSIRTHVLGQMWLAGLTSTGHLAGSPQIGSCTLIQQGLFLLWGGEKGDSVCCTRHLHSVFLHWMSQRVNNPLELKICQISICCTNFICSLHVPKNVRAKYYRCILNIYKTVALWSSLNDHFHPCFQTSCLVFSEPIFFHEVNCCPQYLRTRWSDAHYFCCTQKFMNWLAQ